MKSTIKTNTPQTESQNTKSTGNPTKKKIVNGEDQNDIVNPHENNFGQSDKDKNKNNKITLNEKADIVLGEHDAYEKIIPDCQK